jgi:hypothetical protein
MSTNIELLVQALAQPWQDIESALQQVLQFSGVATAFGVGLDRLGALVGQTRSGLYDDAYARAIATRIAANRSGAVVEDLITIARCFLGATLSGPVVVQNEGAGWIRMSILQCTLTDAIVAQLLPFVMAAAAAGVRCVLEWTDAPPANTFKFDQGPGFDTSHLANAIQG